MPAPSAPQEPLLRQAYAEADHEQRIRISRVGCVLALVLVPLFWGLDWIVYPGQAWPLGFSRLLCDVAIAVIYVLLATGFGRRWIRFLGIAWALAPGVAISWMIWATQGEASPYYAGLNLVMIIVSLLMPWTASEVVVLCMLTIAMYVAACVLHTPATPLSWGPLVTNLYFMVSTGAICVTAGFLAGRRRWSDFCLRHELDRQNRELSEMDRLKTEFYANVSHELRTPLTLILAPLQRFLARADFDRETNKDIGLMHGNALRLLRLINDILEVVRLDSGRIELRRVPIDLSSWVPGLAQSASHLASAKGLTLGCDGPQEPILVRADVSRLEKVMFNLLSNAIKFTPQGGTVTVSWGRDGDKAWFAVSDTGIGIPSDELPNLFRRFHQIDGSATRQFRGLGLGLSLSRELIEKHGGVLTVDSEPGKGSRFRAELPLATQVEAEPAMAPQPQDGAPSDDFIVAAYRAADRQVVSAAVDVAGPALETILEPERQTALADLVLIADDEPDMRRFLASLLTTRHRVILAADGERAVALAHQHRPALILLDLMMPRLDGMEACRRIRADQEACDARIVLLTARGDDDTKLNALQGGADDFLTKPFSSEEVVSRVNNLLENAALQRSLRERNQALESAMQRVREAEAQLIQAEKMNALGSLAAGLLHEINNPLNYAHMAVRLALDEAPARDERLRGMLTDASEGMDRIGNVITSLRTFAHPEADTLESSFELAAAVDLAIRFTSGQCSSLKIAQDLAPGLRVRGSLNQVSMVLVNLLSNAMRAIAATTDGRPPSLRIAATHTHGRLAVTIADNGIGMTPDQLKRAFDPFFTTSEPGRGLGLGLTICHTIVRKHGGTIAVTSTPGDGTTVTIDLPDHEPTAEQNTNG